MEKMKKSFPDGFEELTWDSEKSIAGDKKEIFVIRVPKDVDTSKISLKFGENGKDLELEAVDGYELVNSTTFAENTKILFPGKNSGLKSFNCNGMMHMERIVDRKSDLQDSTNIISCKAPAQPNEKFLRYKNIPFGIIENDQQIIRE